MNGPGVRAGWHLPDGSTVMADVLGGKSLERVGSGRGEGGDGNHQEHGGQAENRNHHPRRALEPSTRAVYVVNEESQPLGD